MQGGVYQTGSSFGMNSYYRPPQIVGTINCFSTRTNGVITPSDPQRPSMQTSVVMGLVKNTSFDQLVNNTQDLKHIDYDQNPKPISIQLYYSAVDPVASIKSLYTGGRRGVQKIYYTYTLKNFINAGPKDNNYINQGGIDGVDKKINLLLNRDYTQTFIDSMNNPTTLSNYNDINTVIYGPTAGDPTDIQIVSNRLDGPYIVNNIVNPVNLTPLKLTEVYFIFTFTFSDRNIKDKYGLFGFYFQCDFTKSNGSNFPYTITNNQNNGFNPYINFENLNNGTYTYQYTVINPSENDQYDIKNFTVCTYNGDGHTYQYNINIDLKIIWM